MIGIGHCWMIAERPLGYGAAITSADVRPIPCLAGWAHWARYAHEVV